MKTIKFRAWFKPLKRMYLVKDLKFQRSGAITVMTNHNGGTAPNSYELMQFTGLEDKNGNYIYEGDLVRLNSDDTLIQQVVFKHGCFKFLLLMNGESEAFNHFNESQLEVIGNIYENPELLNGGSA